MNIHFWSIFSFVLFVISVFGGCLLWIMGCLGCGLVMMGFGGCRHWAVFVLFSSTLWVALSVYIVFFFSFLSIIQLK